MKKDREREREREREKRKIEIERSSCGEAALITRLYPGNLPCRKAELRRGKT